MHLTKDNVVVGDEIEFGIEESLGHVQKLLLEMHGDKVIQIDAESGETLTAIEALNKSIKLAKKLVELGVKKGDAVTVNSENRIEYVMVPLACFYIGAIFAPLNPDYTSGELNHVVNLSKPKVAFCSSSTLKLMIKLKQKHAFIEHLILFGKKPSNNLPMYEDIIRGVTKDTSFDDFEPADLDAKEHVATILCSSGTTGMPKGVMATHRNMTAFMEIARTRVQELYEFEENMSAQSIVTFGLTPFFHSMGFMTMYMNCLGGNLIIVIKKFKAKLFLEAIEKFKVTTLIVPPPVLLVLTKHPLAKNYDFSSLRDIRSGAAPMGKEMEVELREKFKLRHVSQSYGMTETTLGVLVSSLSECRVGSVGKIVPGNMCKVVDEAGNALGPNQEGELCFQGPLIMKGYVNDPTSTANTIDKDGWLHTGDIAYFDKDFYFFIVDRIKELIKYKAFQVAPAELEALLLQHPQVSDVGVIGLPDPDAGELPLAFVVRKDGAKVTEKELQDYVAGKVSRQKRLRGGVIFLEEIPKNPSGKILRRVLKQRAIATASRSKL